MPLRKVLNSYSQQGTRGSREGQTERNEIRSDNNPARPSQIRESVIRQNVQDEQKRVAQQTTGLKQLRRVLGGKETGSSVVQRAVHSEYATPKSVAKALQHQVDTSYRRLMLSHAGELARLEVTASNSTQNEVLAGLQRKAITKAIVNAYTATRGDPDKIWIVEKAVDRQFPGARDTTVIPAAYGKENGSVALTPEENGDVFRSTPESDQAKQRREQARQDFLASDLVPTKRDEERGHFNVETALDSKQSVIDMISKTVNAPQSSWQDISAALESGAQALYAQAHAARGVNRFSTSVNRSSGLHKALGVPTKHEKLSNELKFGARNEAVSIAIEAAGSAYNDKSVKLSQATFHFHANHGLIHPIARDNPLPDIQSSSANWQFDRDNRSASKDSRIREHAETKPAPTSEHAKLDPRSRDEERLHSL